MLLVPDGHCLLGHQQSALCPAAVSSSVEALSLPSRQMSSCVDFFSRMATLSACHQSLCMFMVLRHQHTYHTYHVQHLYQVYHSNSIHHLYHAKTMYDVYLLVCVYIDGVVDSWCVVAGLYAKGTPKGGYPSHLMTGPPKAASVHEMDMTPSRPGPGPGPGATKRRNKAGRNPTSAPGPYVQNWGDAGMPFMGMPGMYHPQSSPHACQLAEAVTETLDAWSLWEAVCGDI